MRENKIQFIVNHRKAIIQFILLSILSGRPNVYQYVAITFGCLTV